MTASRWVPRIKINVNVYNWQMVRVAQRGNVAVYVYDERGAKHHSPHCNVRWPDGNAQIALLTMRKLAGPYPPKEAWRLVQEYQEQALAVWEELNGERHGE
jgi:hypothetical protein